MRGEVANAAAAQPPTSWSRIEDHVLEVRHLVVLTRGSGHRCRDIEDEGRPKVVRNSHRNSQRIGPPGRVSGGLLRAVSCSGRLREQRCEFPRRGSSRHHVRGTPPKASGVDGSLFRGTKRPIVTPCSSGAVSLGATFTTRLSRSNDGSPDSLGCSMPALLTAQLESRLS